VRAPKKPNQFTLELDTSGPEFKELCGEAIAWQLRILAGRLDDGEPSGHVYGRDGKSIGKFYLSPSPGEA
jgi:hypothetical protein